MTGNRWHMRLPALLLLLAATQGCCLYLLGESVEDWKSDLQRHRNQRERAKTVTEEQEALIRQDRKLARKGLEKAFERLAVRLRYHTQRFAFGMTEGAPLAAVERCSRLTIHLRGESELAVRMLREGTPERTAVERFAAYYADVYRIVDDRGTYKLSRRIDKDDFLRRGDEFAALLETLSPELIDERFRERYDQAVERAKEQAMANPPERPRRKRDPLGLDPLEP